MIPDDALRYNLLVRTHFFFAAGLVISPDLSPLVAATGPPVTLQFLVISAAFFVTCGFTKAPISLAVTAPSWS